MSENQKTLAERFCDSLEIPYSQHVQTDKSWYKISRLFDRFLTYAIEHGEYIKAKKSQFTGLISTFENVKCDCDCHTGAATMHFLPCCIDGYNIKEIPVNNDIIRKLMSGKEALRIEISEANEKIKSLEAEVKELKEQVPEWIPVSERLPNENESCLIITNSLFALAEFKFIDPEVEFAFVAEGYTYDIDEETGFDQTEITHWQKLPNPHKTKE